MPCEHLNITRVDPSKQEWECESCGDPFLHEEQVDIALTNSSDMIGKALASTIFEFHNLVVAKYGNAIGNELAQLVEGAMPPPWDCEVEGHVWGKTEETLGTCTQCGMSQFMGGGN